MISKVLITGISGFLGSHTVARLEQAGYEIYGIDIRPSAHPHFICAPISLGALSSFGLRFDYILHFAGGSSVAKSLADPELEWQNTVGSTLAVLEFHQKYNPLAHLIYPSSAAVYAGQYSELISEDACCAPLSPYGHCKLEAEKYLLSYQDRNKAALNIIRFFSIYGEGLRKQLLFDICRRLQKIGSATQFECFGSGEEQRDFIHIDDAVALILMLMRQKTKERIINGGNGTRTTVRRIIELLAAGFGYTGKLEFNGRTRAGDPFSLVADNSKIRALGYVPQIGVEEGVRGYVNWYKKEN